jgi:hypothetical protein
MHDLDLTRARRSWQWGTLGCWLLLYSGCLYDADRRCGDDRHLEGRVCVCDAGEVERAGTCQATARDAGARGPGSACEQDEDCQEGEHRLCKHTPSGASYCTRSNCAGDADCRDGFFCVEDAAPSFCSRSPTGQGKPCSAQSDCEGLDATFCGMGDPRGATCWVPDCTANSCEPGYMCYDVSQLLPGAPWACVR